MNSIKHTISCTPIEDDAPCDNIMIALSSYFEGHYLCPQIKQSELDENGWNSWAVEKAERAVALIAEELVKAGLVVSERK